jgi:hypothetical protein
MMWLSGSAVGNLGLLIGISIFHSTGPAGTNHRLRVTLGLYKPWITVENVVEVLEIIIEEYKHLKLHMKWILCICISHLSHISATLIINIINPCLNHQTLEPLEQARRIFLNQAQAQTPIVSDSM